MICRYNVRTLWVMVAKVAMLHVMTRKPGRKKRGKMMGEEGRWDLSVMKREGGRGSEGEGKRERGRERERERLTATPGAAV